MNNNQNLGLRRGPVGHSFNLPYSLELILDFSEKSFFGKSMDQALPILALPILALPILAHPASIELSACFSTQQLSACFRTK